MLQRNYKALWATSMAMVFAMLGACSLDHVEKRYPDFESASKDGLFDKGWIPTDLVFSSMKDIYQHTDLDLNTCIFSFELSKTDIETVRQKTRPVQATFKNPGRLKIPTEWAMAVDQLDHLVVTSANESDSVYLAIDYQNNKLYGWRE